MLVTAVRGGLATVRRAGLRGVGLTALTALPVIATGRFGLLAVVGLMVRSYLVLGLIRFLGAHRPEPLPALPEVDEAGRRVGRPPHAVAPVGPADTSVRQALKTAGALLRPAIRLTGLHLLIVVTAPLALVAISGNRIADLQPTDQVLLVLPLVALGATFVSVAAQRVALEGDPRVLVAAAHSLRVARFAYGPLFLLNCVQPAIIATGLLVIDPKDPTAAMVAAGVGLFVVSVLAQLVVTATANEIYLTGPRIDVPAEFGARPQAP